MVILVFCTSHANRIDGNEAKKHYSSLSNSPTHSDGLAKDPTEEFPVPSSSDQEGDEVPLVDS